MFSNKILIVLTVVVSIIFGTLLVFMSTFTDVDNISSTITTETTKTITITNTTTFPVQVVTFTTTSVSESVSYVTTTLPPNIVTITSTTTTIIQPQAIITNYVFSDNVTTTRTITYTSHINNTITMTLTKNITKEWFITGANIEQPSLVESVTFTFLNYDRLLQIGSYIAFSPDYVTINHAVMQENNINNTHILGSGNVVIDSISYQYISFDYHDVTTGKLRYAIIAVQFYPEVLRSYYVYYESSSLNALTEMRGYLGTFKIGD